MANIYSRDAAEIIIIADGRELEGRSVATVHRSSGGRSMDTARIRVVYGDPIVNSSFLTAVREIEIISKTERPGGVGDQQFAEKVLFWGFLSGAIGDISDQESITLEASVTPYHFGSPLDGMLEHNPRAGAPQLLVQDLVFNPTVDFASYTGRRIANTRGIGMIRGNMSDAHKLKEQGDANSFLDPACVFTAQARKYSQGGSEATQDDPNEAKYLASDKKWTLKEAVYYLCWALNVNQMYIKNPSRDDLALLDDAQSLLHDVTIPLGTFLPEALDIVLNPFGFGWRIEYLGRGQRTLAFFRRGVGIEKTIDLQKPGDDLDASVTNAAAAQFGVGYQSLINQVRVVSDRALYEGTWELKRAWPKSKDTLSADLDLALGTKEYEEHPENHAVGRNFTLGEGGDLIGVRDERTPYDFKEIFEHETVPRRRRFYPCITLDKDRLPLGQNGYQLEYHDGFEWRAIDTLQNGSYELLTTECGVRFTGLTPPPELFENSTAKLRITASVYDDDRIDYTAERKPRSIQPIPAPVLLDCSDKFHYRKVHKSSIHYEDVKSKKLESSQVDDARRLVEYADRIRDAWDQADVSGAVVIDGLEHEYEIGQVITRIKGRDIALDVGSTAGKRYPQIVGISYDFSTQKQTLALETFRDTKYV